MATWGAFAMLTSAPFDNWWHNAYGLDVKIVSLPHSMLGLGELMIGSGAMLLVCAHLNRASGAYQRSSIACCSSSAGSRCSAPRCSRSNRRRSNSCTAADFYRAMASTFPVVLIAILALEIKWPATTMAAIYTARLPRVPVDFPAISRAAEARAGLPEHHAYGAAMVPDAADCAGVRARPAAAADGRALGQLEIRDRRRIRVSSRCSSRRSGRSRTF